MTKLTARERQVMFYLCKGWSNKEIAAKLGIGHRTIESHRDNILNKQRCRNVVELVRKVYDIPEEVEA
jgi:DNA-binding NarL/FixJ family response regulator